MPRDNAAALQHLAQQHGIELCFNDEGVCAILIDGDAVVRLEGEPRGTGLRLSAAVGSLPDPHDPHALRVLLQANFQGQGTGQASLGLDHVSDEVVLGWGLKVDELGPRGLSPALEAFAVQLAYWRHNLLRLISEPAPATSPAQALGLRA